MAFSYKIMKIWKIWYLSFIQVKYYRDTYAEHPEDRENIEYCVQMEGDDALLTLTELYGQMKALGFNLGYFRYLNLSYLDYQIQFQEKVKKLKMYRIIFVIIDRPNIWKKRWKIKKIISILQCFFRSLYCTKFYKFVCGTSLK